MFLSLLNPPYGQPIPLLFFLIFKIKKNIEYKKSDAINILKELRNKYLNKTDILK